MARKNINFDSDNAEWIRKNLTGGQLWDLTNRMWRAFIELHKGQEPQQNQFARTSAKVIFEEEQES